MDFGGRGGILFKPRQDSHRSSCPSIQCPFLMYLILLSVFVCHLLQAGVLFFGVLAALVPCLSLTVDCLLGCFVILYTVSSAFAGLPFSMRSLYAWVFWSISNNHMCSLLQKPPGQLPVGHWFCLFLRLGVLAPHCTFGPKLTRREDLRCLILLWRLKKKSNTHVEADM